MFNTTDEELKSAIQNVIIIAKSNDKFKDQAFNIWGALSEVF